jgi:hypothetical protein
MNVSQDFIKGGIKDLYSYSMEAAEYEKAKEDWLDIFEEVTVDGDHWQETSVVGPKKLRKTGQNEGFQLSGASEGYTVMAAIFDYTDAIAMSYNTVRDIKKVKNILKSCAEGWGPGAIITRLEFYARMFNKGGFTAGDWIFNGTPESGRQIDTSGNGCYDGTAANIVAPFCRIGDTYKHTSKVGRSTYYNALASGTLSNSSIVNLVNLVEVTNSYDESDVKIPIMVDTIMYPQGKWEDIARILESDKVAGSSLNDKQVIGRKLKYRYENPFLEDTDAIFVGVKKKGIKMLKRMDPVYDFFENKMARAYIATVEMRMGGMFQNFRFWASDNLAQS